MTAAKSHHRWRENIEALTMAIVVALLFKSFVLEISKIPSGSMQPTLMGNPETGVYDRTVVDKLSFQFRDPQRFEIVVFKHPLERSRIMVKRLVGMPGEELEIAHGDLFVRANETEAWHILRKPASVQREMWRTLVADGKHPDWSVVRGGKDWRISGDGIVARGEGLARFRADAGPIVDGYLDGYPAALVGRISNPDLARTNDPERKKNPVADLRLEGAVSALAGLDALTVEMTEGQHLYEFTLPGPHAAADATVSVRIKDSAAGTERVERGEPFRLTADARARFAVENLDDRLALELDGRTLLSAEIEASERQEASLTLGVKGEGAELTGLGVARDTCYVAPDRRLTWKVEIPPGSYVMLGDNTQDSADSRLWKAKTYNYRVGGAGSSATLEARGNYREGNENPSFPSVSDANAPFRFKDIWGELHWITRGALVQPESFPGNAPLVPRELILGRAVAVFWPIQPFEGLWRLSWLH